MGSPPPQVLVTLGDGVLPPAALTEGRGAAGLALIRPGSGTAPWPGARLTGLGGRILTAGLPRATRDIRLTSRKTYRVHRIELTGGMHRHDRAVNGERWDMHDPAAHAMTVEAGRRVRLDFVDTTTVWHPMHLHGHTYQFVVPGRVGGCVRSALPS